MAHICPIHQVAFVEKPGGVSKTTGKPYNAFSCCPSKNADGSFCKEKPPKVVGGPGAATNAFQASVVMGRIEGKLDTIIAMLKNQTPGMEFKTLQNTSNGKPVDLDIDSIPF